MDQPLSIPLTLLPPYSDPRIESVVFNVSYERVPPTEAQRQALETEGGYSFSTADLPRAARCQLRMKNGWFVVGCGPVRAPADYDAAAEERVAYADAWTQIQRRLDLAAKRDRAARVAAEVAADPGFEQLLKQQLQEIELASKSFDYAVFAGAQGPLSGPDSVESGCLAKLAHGPRFLRGSGSGPMNWDIMSEWLAVHRQLNQVRTLAGAIDAALARRGWELLPEDDPRIS